MDFSTAGLKTLEEQIVALSGNISQKLKCRGMEDLSGEKLKSRNVTKETLADIVLCMSTVILESRRVLNSAKVKFEEQNSELLKSQKGLIQVQNELIACQKTKLSAVTETVQKEIKTFSDAVQKNCSSNNTSTFTPAKLKKVVRSAFTDEERPRNFLIFGAEEDLYYEGSKMTDEDLVEEIFSVVGEKLPVEKCGRIGVRKTDGMGRPIKVTLRNNDAVKDVLSGAKALKNIVAPAYSFKFSKLYLAPDRTDEERKVQKKLVQEMKESIKANPSKRYYIRDKKVCMKTTEDGLGKV
jgi:hypothetical protein